MTALHISLAAIMMVVLASCATQPTLNGLWQSSTGTGSIEFKATGEVIIVDNMSATVTGRYKLKGDDSITFELTASDIFRDSVQPDPMTVVNAKIIELDGDRLRLRIAGEASIENYSRVR